MVIGIINDTTYYLILTKFIYFYSPRECSIISERSVLCHNKRWMSKPVDTRIFVQV